MQNRNANNSVFPPFRELFIFDLASFHDFLKERGR